MSIGEAKARLVDSIEAVSRLPDLIADQPPNQTDEWMVYAVLKQYHRNAQEFMAEFVRVAVRFVAAARKVSKQEQVMHEG